MTGDPQRKSYNNKVIIKSKRMDEVNRKTMMAVFNQNSAAKNYCDMQNGDLAFKDEDIRAQLNKKAKDKNNRDIMN